MLVTNIGLVYVPLFAYTVYAPVMSITDRSADPKQIDGELGTLFLSIPNSETKLLTNSGFPISIISLTETLFFDFFNPSFNVKFSLENPSEFAGAHDLSRPKLASFAGIVY